MSLSSERPTELFLQPYQNEAGCSQGCGIGCQIKSQAATVNNYDNLDQKLELIRSIRSNLAFRNSCIKFNDIDPALKALELKITRRLEGNLQPVPKGAQRFRRSA